MRSGLVPDSTAFFDGFNISLSGRLASILTNGLAYCRSDSLTVGLTTGRTEAMTDGRTD